MGKLLKVLTVVFLLLSAGALVLGIMLFGKRELLKGRAHNLEKAFIQVGGFIEADAPKAERKADYPARDVSAVSAEVIDQPELSKFWDSYAQDLELTDQATLNLNQRRYELMSYYKMDATGKIQPDPMGNPITTGEGTMQAVLDDVITKAEAQYNLLNKTRQQLVSTRTELVDIITDLNQNKSSLRRTMKEVEDKKAEVTRLEGEVRTQKTKADELAEQNKALEDQAGEQKRQIALLEEAKVEVNAQMDQLKKEIEELRKQIGILTTSGAGTRVVGVVEEQKLRGMVSPGEKGTVIAVDPKWSFVIVQLSETFMKEVMGPDLSQPLPAMEMMIKRAASDGKPEIFVTKVRLQSLRKAERIAVADILTDWQQAPVAKGDQVFF